MGSTTLSLHIHTGWENCIWCDPSRGVFWSGDSVKEAELPDEELDLQRRKELNRIKKRYGLRVRGHLLSSHHKDKYIFVLAGLFVW